MKTSKTRSRSGRAKILAPSARLSVGDPSQLVTALRSSKTVSGATHQFYRYPARFSPDFAREAIRLFSGPGDVVLDPFMGGGTSAVEALAEGRTFCGNDINELALFVSKVKTSLLTLGDEVRILDWASSLPAWLNLAEEEPEEECWKPYQKHLPWRLRKLFAQALSTIEALKKGPQQDFARCSLLVTAQWALDCKGQIPSKDRVLTEHQTQLAKMIAGSQDFRARASRSLGGGTAQFAKNRVLMCGDTSDLHTSYDVARLGRPKLVVTSPPYLGVHVLYHRWQILGRRETGAPYWIANASDGHSGVFYTLADRKPNARERYLQRLTECFSSIRQITSKKTNIVQLVAFPDPDIELPLYLQALDQAGLEQCELVPGNGRRSASQRQVPNRRWYARLSNQSQSSTEFLLIHRQKR